MDAGTEIESGVSGKVPVYQKSPSSQILSIRNFIFAQIPPVVKFPLFRTIEVLLADQGGCISMVTGVLGHGRSHKAYFGVAIRIIAAGFDRFTRRL